MKIRVTLVLLILGLTSPLAQAQLIGLYEFNGDFANSLSGAGALGSLQESNAGGATTGFSSGAWTWSGATNDPGTGVRLQLDAPLSVYSIGITFQFTEVSDYRKLLDFSNATADPGIYISSGTFDPYGLAISTGGTISADTSTTIVLTRDATDWVYLYVNGSSTAVTNGLENDDYLVADVWRFFMDDGGGEFSPGGSVHEIRVWDYALSSGEIATAFDPVAVPEPSTYSILAGLAALGLGAWRRRAATKAQTAA